MESAAVAYLWLSPVADRNPPARTPRIVGLDASATPDSRVPGNAALVGDGRLITGDDVAAADLSKQITHRGADDSDQSPLRSAKCKTSSSSSAASTSSVT